MFFNIGGAEILVIAVVALIAIGPEQLPGVMRKVGGFVAQARSVTTGLRDEFMSGMDEISDLTDPKAWMGSGADDDPVVPRGFAQREANAGVEADANDDASNEATSSRAAARRTASEHRGGQLGRLDVPPPFSPSPGATKSSAAGNGAAAKAESGDSATDEPDTGDDDTSGADAEAGEEPS